MDKMILKSAKKKKKKKKKKNPHELIYNIFFFLWINY